MSKSSIAAKRSEALRAAIDTAAVLGALPDPVLVVDGAGRLLFANAAAEQFLDTGVATFLGAPLAELLPADSPVLSLLSSVRESGHSVSEYGVTIETPRLGCHVVTVQAAPIAEDRDDVVITLQERSIAHKIDRQLVHRNAARSVTAMAAMLAHEVKNPLSGIRGAAHLRRERPHLRPRRPHGGVLRPAADRARPRQHP
jgi:two-component system nitrogen regulation sensor histidine kinase GlnL